MSRVWGELFVQSHRVHSRRLTRWLYLRYIAARHQEAEPHDP